MLNRMIDEATLNDLQIVGYPKMIVTDEVFMDLERKKRNVAVQQKEKAQS